MADDMKLKKDAALAPDDFDLMVEDLTAELMPESGVADKVTPWKSAMYKVVLGLALLIIQFNFWGLNFILPLAGSTMLLIGSRSLRKENGGFRALYAGAVIMAVLRGFLLVSAASCLWSLSFAKNLNNIIGIPGLLLNLWLLGAFRTGLAETMEKSGTELKTGWATAAVIWYLLVIVLGLTGLAEALIYVLAAVYVVMIIALLIQARNMDKAGYVLQPEPSRISDLGLGGLYVGIIAVGIIICGLFFSRLPMDWNPKSEVDTQIAKQSAQQLAELGVPESIINDLDEEDLALLWGADKVLIQELPENKDNDSSPGLVMTHVAVRTPSDGSSSVKYIWHFIHHFEWPGEAHFAGTETIHMDALLSVVNNQGQFMDNTVFNISGRILVDRDGDVYEAPYYGHTLKRYVSGDKDNYTTGWVMDFRLDRTIFNTKFSFPFRTENARGYIMYDTWLYTEDCIFRSDMVYWHHKGLAYPFTDPSGLDSIIRSWSYLERIEQVRFSTLD